MVILYLFELYLQVKLSYKKIFSLPQIMHVCAVNTIFRIAVASCSPKETISGFLTGIENSGWMKHIHLILEASIFSAKVRVYRSMYVVILSTVYVFHLYMHSDFLRIRTWLEIGLSHSVALWDVYMCSTVLSCIVYN